MTAATEGSVGRNVMQRVAQFLDHEIMEHEAPKETVEKMEDKANSVETPATDALAPILDPLIFFLLQQQIGNQIVPNAEKLEEVKPSVAKSKKFEQKKVSQKYSNTAKNIRMQDHKSAGRRRC